jgi:hypothetical protein
MTFIDLNNYKVHRIGPLKSGHAFDCCFTDIQRNLAKPGLQASNEAFSLVWEMA